MTLQHAQNPKEECFEAATTALQALRGKYKKSVPTLTHQRAWTRDARRPYKWRIEPPTSVFWNLINSAEKTLRLIKDPPEDEAGKRDASTRYASEQMRYPDVTVTRPDGAMVVIDTKFDRPSGGRDSWNAKTGKYSGQDQVTDYNEINEQQTGKPGLSLSLDADVCACPKRPKRIDDDQEDFLEDAMPLITRGGKSASEQPGDAPSDAPPGPNQNPRPPPEIEDEPDVQLPSDEPEIPADDPEIPPDFPEVPEIPVGEGAPLGEMFF